MKQYQWNDEANKKAYSKRTWLSLAPMAAALIATQTLGGSPIGMVVLLVCAVIALWLIFSANKIKKLDQRQNGKI